MDPEHYYASWYRKVNSGANVGNTLDQTRNAFQVRKSRKRAEKMQEFKSVRCALTMEALEKATLYKEYEPRISREAVNKRASSALKKLESGEKEDDFTRREARSKVVEITERGNGLRDELYMLTRKIEEARGKLCRRREREKMKTSKDKYTDARYKTTTQQNTRRFKKNAYLDPSTASYHPHSMVSRYADEISKYRSALPGRSKQGF
eukprot:g434.t1